MAAAYPGTLVPASRFGIDRITGKQLVGWEHALQSIRVIFTTAFNTRVMRLTFGSDIPNLIDRPANDMIIMSWYMAIVTALTMWEPGFKITQMELVTGGPSGSFTFDVAGIFYPYGHLGNFSVAIPKNTLIPIFPTIA